MVVNCSLQYLPSSDHGIYLHGVKKNLIIGTFFLHFISEVDKVQPRNQMHPMEFYKGAILIISVEETTDSSKQDLFQVEKPLKSK